MAFDIAVSGMNAASNDLSIIGNNIANASTAGFKGARGEFSDVYATSAFGQSKTSIGSGVLLNDVAQQFKQGSITFTNNNLDMAINGQGFFSVKDSAGALSYTRAGYFNVDKNGVMVNNIGKKLQGYLVNNNGRPASHTSDITIQTTNIYPKQTTAAAANINFPANAVAPEVINSTASTTGAAVGLAKSGTLNGYAAETLTLTDAQGTTQTLTTTANASAATTATAINSLKGVTATASSTATLSSINDAGGLQVRLNGVLVTTSTGANSITATTLAAAINSQTNSNLPGITASVSGTSVIVKSSKGDDLQLSITASNAAGDGMTVTGTTGAGVVLAGNGTTNASVGGKIDLTFNNGYTLTSNGAGANLFPAQITQTIVRHNSFDPLNPDTYNKSTSLTIYDSQGNPHDMELYYVREQSADQWSVYVQIDGKDVGDPQSPSTAATRAGFSIFFNKDGSLDKSRSSPLNISYWTPLNAAGNPQAMGPLTVANGATFPVPDPPTSSNFSIDLSGSTQFGSSFSQNSLTQNGYTTGQLSGLDISSDGNIYARFTNGQSKILAQVALANFSNPQGLRPNGNTAWVETNESGQAIIGAPGSSGMGAIQGGALEQSNIDLSSSLVDLIVAQRNFQANAKTIQTADAITQAIINIR